MSVYSDCPAAWLGISGKQRVPEDEPTEVVFPVVPEDESTEVVFQMITQSSSLSVVDMTMEFDPEEKFRYAEVGQTSLVCTGKN